jgi:CcmD family protein
MRALVDRFTARVALGALWMLLAGPAVLAAQSNPPPAASETDRATSFEAVEGAVKEDVPGGPLLLAAYAIVWLAVLGYVWRLSRLHARVEESIGTLTRSLASATSDTDAARTASSLKHG